MYDNSYINVLNSKGEKVHLTYTSDDVLDHGQQNLSLCEGDNLMLELVEPSGSRSSVLEMDQIMYAYRGTGFTKNKEKGFGTSESCQVNVNCSEGNDWQDEKRGVARILVVIPGAQGWCTGSLVNNTRLDCTPYLLTAMHCAEDVTTSNLNSWRFYFNYEATGCSNPSSEGLLGTKYTTGCVKIAASEDISSSGNLTKSDFYLIHLGSFGSSYQTVNRLKSYNAYWNGWDANNTASPRGVGIHHPDGDLKKISHYTATVSSVSYGGVNPNTHWMTTWVSTTNGFGVTEPGSSGSPLFNFNGGNSRIVGTLSGGSSTCNFSDKTDLYGKMSYHWASAGSSSSLQLKPWLDPESTGLTTIDGSSDPCLGQWLALDKNNVDVVSIFPNPTSDKLTVELTDNVLLTDVVLIDLTGKEMDVEFSKSTNKIELNISNVSKGLYQLIIHTNQGKIVKNILKN